MQNVFFELATLDKNACDRYLLSEEILMENAARGVYEFLKQKGLENKKTLVVAGGGNNGADGLSLARMLKNCSVLQAIKPKSELCKLQFERAKRLDVEFVKEIADYEIVIDALLGSGIKKPLEGEIKELIEHLNSLSAIKVAIDIPSGVRDDMDESESAFAAHYTITMGAHKLSLYSDYAKEFTGEIVLKELGLSFERYTEGFTPSARLLEKSDLILPKRTKKSSHKGDYGHLCIVAGDMLGAAQIGAEAALRFGVGLVTICERDFVTLSNMQVMLKNTPPKEPHIISIGQGLGEAYSDTEIVDFIRGAKAAVIDADIFKKKCIKEILKLQTPLVLTPHPKEFCTLFKTLFGRELSVKELQRSRFFYAKEFCKKYPNTVLVLKGANTLIASKEELYINPLGTPALAKAGSGDMLDGLIGALLAQGYLPQEAAIGGSLALTVAASKVEANNYSLQSADILEELRWL